MKLSQQYAAKKKREERTRMRLKGYILRQMWVHPKDWPSVSAMLRGLKDDREESV